jgi:hypothetical protein
MTRLREGRCPSAPRPSQDSMTRATSSMCPIRSQCRCGSSQSQPVALIPMPISTTPTETAASAAMCKNAPLILISRLRTAMNSNAETVLMTTPAAATHMTVLAATTSGCAIRPIASQAIPTTTTSNTMALVRAAKIEDRRKPYVRRLVGRDLPR